MKKMLFAVLLLLALPAAFAYECGVSISIVSDRQTFANNEQIEFLAKINETSSGYTIEYWIDDADGNFVKNPMNTTNQAKKSFTPKNISKDITIKARIASLECNDKNSSDNYAQKTIIFAEPEGNSTHRDAVISFEVNNDYEKLANLASSAGTNEQSGKKNSRVLKLVPYFLIALATLISIALVWRR